MFAISGKKKEEFRDIDWSVNFAEPIIGTTVLKGACITYNAYSNSFDRKVFGF